ncbi:MAG: hypothetical protein ACE5LA_02805 [Dehalococcoidales bacterium]
MAKYDPLREYLRKQPMTTTQVVLSFQQIEKIIGQSMEPAARKWLRAWDNTPSAPRQDSWLDVGWEVTMADLNTEKVRFQRIKQKARQSERGIAPPSPTKFSTPCRYCDATGIDPDPLQRVCYACQGKKQHELEGSRGDYRVCVTCGGSGRDPDIIVRLKPCRICHGSGLESKNE